MAKGLIGKARAALMPAAEHDAPISRNRDDGDAARDRGQWSQAAALYQSYLDARPNDFAIWVQLGHAHKEAGDPLAAERAYRAAEALDGANADLLLNLGHLMKSRLHLAEAADYYGRSHAVDGNAAARREMEAIAADGSVLPRAAPPSGTAVEVIRPAGPFVGSVDLVIGGEVRGWAIEPAAGAGPAEVELVMRGGRVIGSAVAHRERPDVAAAGYGTSLAGFSIFIDAEDLAGVTIQADARLRSTGDALSGSPVTITVPDHRDSETAEDDRVTTARYVVAKPLLWQPGEHALLVAYAATGMLQPFLPRYIGMLKAAGIAVTLVVNTDRPVLLDDTLLDLLDCAIVRDNRGYDFGAWAHALHIVPALYGAETLYIVNDSVFGPRDEASFATMIERVRASRGDLVGLTQTLERGWHIQSYFMAVKRSLLASYAFQFFVNDIRVLPSKDSIIDTYEVPLAKRVRESGFEVDVLFPVEEGRNPTLFAWRRLIAADYPFVKLLLLRGGFPAIDTRKIKKSLRLAGFDLDMLDETMRYGTDEGPAREGFSLLAKPALSNGDDTPKPAKPYKVAFYGPWNYDNGLGSASRGIIAAIRQTGVRLNLHPIKRPFHIHKPLVPPHDIIDFDGPADIAIVHLNPDSWHLLTPDQLRGVRAAGKRIGYWVWEMDHLPPFWRREFSSVDRIWAPSGYCAELFEAQDEAPVDIVPHAVPVDQSDDAVVDRARVTEGLGLSPEDRIILYVFDGSSYLVRKNPAALVRAFANSMLAASGWKLVLKTKHLMDRPEEGAAFTTLALSTPGVVLIDRSLTSGELQDLLQVADIYASPHCSEGFGLTVAEAMAAGKSVVATDFSGTRQFLDETCGFPVRAHAWTLEEDYGHYTKGGTWARIDEGAMSDALFDAASAIDGGDRSMGDAARARVEQALSFATVSAAIGASFDAVIGEDKPIRRSPPRIDGGEDRGIVLDHAAFGDSLAIMPLASGTLEPATFDELSRVTDDPEAWLMVVPEDARIHPLTHRILARHAEVRPDVAIFYADDVLLDAPTILDQIRLKPEFDKTLFAAQDYIGAPVFIRGSALHALGGLDPHAGDACLFDLVLRALEQGLSVARIPEILVIHTEIRPTASLTSRQVLLERSPLYAGYTFEPGRTPETLQLSRIWADEYPAVTLCVPTQRTRVPGSDDTFIERFLRSVATVDWPLDRLTVLVGDDGEGIPDWAGIDWPFTLRHIDTARVPGTPFNYSAKMNRLWRAADSEIVVLMNDDVVALDDAWLRALVSFAVDGGVGGVGARLLYDDGTIQHAGMVGGIMGTSVHAWLGRRAGAKTYQDWAATQREWSMLTGAVFATRRSVLQAVDGFDEIFSLEFNDVDLCLKIRAAGYRIVYTPFAEMTHSEKASRAETIPPGEQVALFLSRWQGWLQNDPAFHPKMRRDLIDLAPGARKGDWYL